jgi:hypothetical protein
MNFPEEKKDTDPTQPHGLVTLLHSWLSPSSCEMRRFLTRLAFSLAWQAVSSFNCPQHANLQA